LNLSGADWTPAGLWLAVVASGLYHGVSPGMGWPLAVSAGLMEGRSRALVAALGPLWVGHLLAMLLVFLPFALLVAAVEEQRQIQVGASLLVIGFGIFRLVNRRHPKALARIRPTQLALWSFAVAIAHGAGLMLVPIYLGLCRASEFDKGHEAAEALVNGSLVDGSLGTAVLVSVVHSASMIAAGGVSAWLVYRYLGLKFVSRSWFNLDTIWAVSLILVGALALAINLTVEGNAHTTIQGSNPRLSRPAFDRNEHSFQPNDRSSLRLVNIPEHRRRRAVEHAGERFPPRARREILPERDIDHLIVDFPLDVGRELLLLVG
jgi:hypothetical protein